MDEGHRSRRRLGGALLIGLALGVLATAPVLGAWRPPASIWAAAVPSSPAPPAPPCTPVWQLVAGPEAGTSDNGLTAVAARTSSDIWAVGDYLNGAPDQALIEHWNGSQWMVIPSPPAGTTGNRLFGVATRAADDAWAVGAMNFSQQTLVEHWNGSQWAVVPSPDVGPGQNQFNGVAALAADDVWAVGKDGAGHTLTEHWNGSQWAVVPSPNAGSGGNTLVRVVALAAGDVWATGRSDAGAAPHTLTEHWNGTTWTVVPSPDGSPYNFLDGLAAVASGDVWTVGHDYAQGGRPQTLALHWNGTSWVVLPSPNVGTGSNGLVGVAALAPADVWSVGSYDINGNTPQTLTMHWDGTSWTVVPSPNAGTSTNSPADVAAVASDDVWAVGTYYDDSARIHKTLFLHYACPPATATPANTPTPASATATHPPPSATVTNTPPPPGATTTTTPPPAGATATSTPPPPGATTTNTPLPASPTPANSSVPASATPARTPTQTPSARPTAPGPSATACPSHFSDVPATAYFYTPVRYLACHWVISGYGDGTFRPYNQTTRAQMIKIVVLGFQQAITTPPAAGYTFADVPPGFPFFAVIETAVAHQVVSGYICGGPGEPCDPQRRPYFRPYANVTRGQLAKIAVVAAGWPLLTPAGGTFADVLPGTAFYPFVETASCHGVISGYACGGPGEPCDAAQRPYFRQVANATRGQIAKIVYLGLTGPSPCPGVEQDP